MESSDQVAPGTPDFEETLLLPPPARPSAGGLRRNHPLTGLRARKARMTTTTAARATAARMQLGCWSAAVASISKKGQSDQLTQASSHAAHNGTDICR